MMKRLAAVIVLMALAVPAWANHPPTTDSGEDITNIGEAMNQETFWESWFDGPGYSVECTKFEGHNGSIPSSYEAAVVKSGSDWVRVYWDPPSTVIGPPNPNDAHPNRRHVAPFSWVMKCDFTEDAPLPPTVTSTCDTVTIDAAEGVEWAIQIGDGYVDGEGTDAFHGSPGQSWAVFYNDQTIASGVFESCTPEDTTTTTEQPSSTTTTPTESTTSTTVTSTSTTPPTTTTTPATTSNPPAPTSTAPTTPSILPFTDTDEQVPLAIAGLALLGLGAAVLRGRKCDTD